MKSLNLWGFGDAKRGGNTTHFAAEKVLVPLMFGGRKENRADCKGGGRGSRERVVVVEWNEVWQVALLIVCTAGFFHRSKESRLVSTRSFDQTLVGWVLVASRHNWGRVIQLVKGTHTIFISKPFGVSLVSSKSSSYTVQTWR